MFLRKSGGFAYEIYNKSLIINVSSVLHVKWYLLISLNHTIRVPLVSKETGNDSIVVS